MEEEVQDADAGADANAGVAVASGPRRIDFGDAGHAPAADALVRGATSRLAAALAAELGSALRLFVKVDASEPVRRTRADVAASLAPSASCVPLALSAPAGQGWLVLERGLLFALADVRYGGAGVPSDDGRVPSASERRIAAALSKAVCRALESAWRPVTPLAVREAARTETSAERERFATGGHDELFHECGFGIDAGGGVARGSVLLAHSAIATLVPRASAPAVHRLEHAGTFGNELAAGVGTCEVELVGVLAEQGITLGELAGLRPGDFIALDERRAVRFRTGGRDVFDARVGMNDGRVAASVTRLHLPIPGD